MPLGEQKASTSSGRKAIVLLIDKAGRKENGRKGLNSRRLRRAGAKWRGNVLRRKSLQLRIARRVNVFRVSEL